MRTVFLSLTFTFAAAAQTATEENVERTLRFTHTSTPEDVQEIATVIRSVAEIRNLSIDTAQRSSSLRATAPQAALAEWLAAELDRPATQTVTPNAREYRL